MSLAKSVFLASLLSGSFVWANGATPPEDPNTPPPSQPVSCSLPVAPKDCLKNNASVCQHDLLTEVEGFGKDTTGGLNGPIYQVTSLDDSTSNPAKGTLRYGVNKKGKLWIVFAKSGTIKLAGKLSLTSDKTIDGRGAKITLKNGTLNISKVSNVILNDFVITESVKGGADTEGVDNITLGLGAKNVWIHHVESSKSGDGLIDMSHGATNVTVSWSRLTGKPNKAMLISATLDKQPGKVTLHHNHWYRGDDRQPKIDGYQVHIYNDYHDLDENGSDITCYNGCQVFVENSVWNPKYGSGQSELTAESGSDKHTPGYGRVSGNLMKSPSTISGREPNKVFDPRGSYSYTAEQASEQLACLVSKYAGPR